MFNPYDGDLTFRGQVMASLPIDIKLTQLILLGNLFNLLRESIVIGTNFTVSSASDCQLLSSVAAASLSVQSFFIKSLKGRFEHFK